MRKRLLIIFGIIGAIAFGSWEILVTNSENNPDSRQNRAARRETVQNRRRNDIRIPRRREDFHSGNQLWGG